MRFGSDEVTEEVAVRTKFKMVQEGDRLSPAGANLLQLMEIALRNEVCMYYIHLAISQVSSKDYTINS
jgi:hypothetical protein